MSMKSKIDDTIGNIGFLSNGAMPYLAFGLVFLLFHICADPIWSEFLLRLFILFAILCVVTVGVFLYRAVRLNHERAIFLTITIGVLIRLVYVIYTDIYTRQHDIVWSGNTGHIGYIMHIAQHLRLPDTNQNIFYHAPLHHLISGTFYRINEFFGMNTVRNMESLQYLTAFYSSCLMVVAYRIFRKLDIKDAPLLMSTAIVALHPTMFILAGSINNDMLTLLLNAAALLWLIYWYDSPDIKNTVVLAIFVGAAVMTKMSGGLIALVVAPVFLIKFFRSQSKKSLAAKLALFGAVSLPIGLWYHIRNLILFKQPIGYFLPLGESYVLYTGEIPLVDRIFSIPMSEMFKGIYSITWDGAYNLPVFVMKSSIFGEWSFRSEMDILAITLLSLNIILIIVSLAAMTCLITNRQKEERGGAWFLFLIWFTQMAMFLYYNIKFPYSPNMDFRYIPLTLICGAGFIGLACGNIPEKHSALWKKARRCVFVLAACFCANAALFYMFVY